MPGSTSITRSPLRECGKLTTLVIEITPYLLVSFGFVALSSCTCWGLFLICPVRLIDPLGRLRGSNTRTIRCITYREGNFMGELVVSPGKYAHTIDVEDEALAALQDFVTERLRKNEPFLIESNPVESSDGKFAAVSIWVTPNTDLQFCYENPVETDGLASKVMELEYQLSRYGRLGL
ncbi:DUF7882 family protein [Glutamicibacter arilaitensis]|uniref:DUF7882 family protein n=1 Tax=Glutamicibacter arilaitensis TaxID=256701 RepID=UPI003FD570FB